MKVESDPCQLTPVWISGSLGGGAEWWWISGRCSGQTMDQQTFIKAWETIKRSNKGLVNEWFEEWRGSGNGI